MVYVTFIKSYMQLLNFYIKDQLLLTVSNLISTTTVLMGQVAPANMPPGSLLLTNWNTLHNYSKSNNYYS